MKQGIIFSLIICCALSVGIGQFATPDTAQASPFQSAQLHVEIGAPIHIHHHRRHHRRHVIVEHPIIIHHDEHHDEHHDNGHHNGDDHHDKH